MDNEKDILAEFHVALGENNKNEEALTHLFRKKIKRSRKKPRPIELENARPGTQGSDEANIGKREAASDDGSDVDFDDDEFDFDDESGSDSEDDLTSFDAEDPLYQQVLQLREKRLDQEDILADIQKAIEVSPTSATTFTVTRHLRKTMMRLSRRKNWWTMLSKLLQMRFKVSRIRSSKN